ncbi:MAG: ATP-binding protein [Thiomicrospira sp.]|jgi:PAS domain S-box-containing protein|nr:ATP-binding protein [Thiomicrospira sp.]
MKAPRKFPFLMQYGWIVLLSGLLLGSLFMMSRIVRTAPDFAQSYLGLLLFSAIGTLILLALLLRTLFRLHRQYKQGVSGIKTTIKLTSTLTLLLAFPIVILYYFAISFIHQGIDQWFDVRTEQALSDASALVRANLDHATRDSLNQTLRAEQSLRPLLTQNPAMVINELRQQLNAQEVALYQSNGQLLAFSHSYGTRILPTTPGDNLFQQVRQRHSYAAVESLPETGQEVIRIVVPINDPFINQVYPLQAIFPIPDNITRYAQSVRHAESQYHELNYLRQPLKTSFTLILSMVLLLTLVTALLFTVQAAQNLTRPIRRLIQGTQRVAQGDYTTQMQVSGNDEFGRLMQSFNDMTQQIAKTRNEIKINHQQTEVQRLYFQAIIRNLTNGVLTLDMNRRIRTYNEAASHILGLALQDFVGQPFCDLLEKTNTPHLKPFFDAVTPRFEASQMRKSDPKPWHEQINLQLDNEQRIILIHGSTLPSIDQKIGGFVMVLDDITELVQAQRHVAWSDVARRLAHEIKNPLTPIQLSAERLQMKLSPKLDDSEQAFLQRMTRTIIDQVDTMQALVQAFIDYAHTPQMQRRLIDLNELILDIVSLYQTPNQDENDLIQLQLDAQCPLVLADSARLRQLFHNLIKNALEASENSAQARIRVRTDCARYRDKIEVEFCDNGQGLPEQAKNWIFEPYATAKPKGTGLGLAIVKKIVEEHNGQIDVTSVPGQGTCFTLILSKVNVDDI